MAKDPAFLFYSQDWIVGTMDMTFEERGQYIHLLATMHQKGRLDEKTCRFLVGNISENLSAKFSIDENGLWYNKRLELEAEKRSRSANASRANGSKGGRPKKGKPDNKPKNNLQGSLSENENEVESINEGKGGMGETDLSEYWQNYAELPDQLNNDIFRSKWAQYEAARAAEKMRPYKAVTRSAAIRTLIADTDGSLEQVIAGLDQSIAGGEQGTWASPRYRVERKQAQQQPKPDDNYINEIPDDI